MRFIGCAGVRFKRPPNTNNSVPRSYTQSVCCCSVLERENSYKLTLITYFASSGLVVLFVIIITIDGVASVVIVVVVIWIHGTSFARSLREL